MEQPFRKLLSKVVTITGFKMDSMGGCRNWYCCVFLPFVHRSARPPLAIFQRGDFQ